MFVSCIQAMVNRRMYTKLYFVFCAYFIRMILITSKLCCIYLNNIIAYISVDLYIGHCHSYKKPTTVYIIIAKFSVCIFL